MPQLVRTPEDVLRETKRDLYLIRFKEWVLGSENLSARSEVEQWFAANLPSLELEPLGLGEKSGFLAGDTGAILRADFSPEALAYFVSVWEHPDGSYKDERWDCVYMSYSAFAAAAETT